MHTPRIGSLFSGYGGLDLAVEEFFGARTVWHCQYEPPDKKGRADKHQYAAAVLRQHWPSVPNLGDITRVDWDQVEPVDILTGGFPCTDVSLAGQRAGLNDQTRSGLWAHMAQAISVLRPKVVVIENVRGLLSAPADRGMEPGTASVDPATGRPLTLRALGAVLGDLAGLGFDAEWCGVRASDVGAPHERFRVFILAWPAASHPDQLGAHRPGTRSTGRAEPEDCRQPAAHANCLVPGYDGELPAGRDAVRHGVWEDAPRCGAAPTNATGLGHGNTRPTLVGGLSPAVVPGGSSAPADPGRGGQLPAERDVQQGQPHADWGAYEPAIRRWEFVLGRPAPWPVDDRGRLSPALPEWMQGLPEGWLTADPIPAGMTPSQLRNAQLKAAGNGVVPQQAYAALAELWHRATSGATELAA